MNWMVILRRIGGTAMFMLGIVSLVLPILPGWLFIGVGLYILSKDSPGMQGRLHVLRTRYHHVEKVMNEVERRMGHEPRTKHSHDSQTDTHSVDDATTPPRGV